MQDFRNYQPNSSIMHEPYYVNEQDAQLSHRDRAAGCVTVLAESGRLGLGDNISADITGLSSTGLKICRIWWKKRQIRVITAFIVIHGHRGRYQSKVRMRLLIQD